MENLEDILAISTNFDVRAETLAAFLIGQAEGMVKDFDIEKVIVKPLGNTNRRIRNDVEDIKRKYYDDDNVALSIAINRKGLFDTLPNRLFLRLDEDYEDAKTKTRAIEQQIKEARQFFLPFEQAMYHPRIEAEQLEQKYTEEFPKFFYELWGLPEFKKELDNRQRFLLCYLLPEAYRVVGDWNLTGLCFEALLQKPVDLTFVAPLELEIPDAHIPTSERRMGVDSIVGNHFRDDMPALKVVIKGITKYDLPAYLEGGNNLRILENLLYSYFLPLDVAVVTKIQVTEDTYGFTLGENILGYSIKFV